MLPPPAINKIQPVETINFSFFSFFVLIEYHKIEYHKLLVHFFTYQKLFRIMQQWFNVLELRDLREICRCAYI